MKLISMHALNFTKLLKTKIKATVPSSPRDLSNCAGGGSSGGGSDERQARLRVQEAGAGPGEHGSGLGGDQRWLVRPGGAVAVL